MSDTVWLAMWDNTGLECIINLSDLDKERFLKKLGGQDGNSLPFSLNAMLLRARMNHQRHYEIYTFTTDESITKEDLIDQFKHSPQQIVDLIRERGTALFDDRARSKTVIT